jgi:hypothetical protein
LQQQQGSKPIFSWKQIFNRKSLSEAEKSYKGCHESPRKKSYFFLSTEELNKLEKPLLLNPFVVEVNNFIKFDDGGQILPKDEKRGENTIQVLHLEREDLMDGRINAQISMMDFIDDFHKARKYDNYKEKQKEALMEIKKLTMDGKVNFQLTQLFM